MSLFDKKLPNDLKKIWEASEQENTPTGPSTADAWMRLEQRLDIKDPAPARVVQHRKNYFPIQPRLAYAFTLMIIALLTGPKIYDLATYITVSAERGGQPEINLADGTSVRLNSESLLKYKRNFNSESRIVNLSGEGYFQVVKGDYPFTVETLY
ncbi:MAG: FecR domain-containing protein, partial [Candidatus Marinimicrobia bacterium]|nr:FecR domain-containing protein [Candidatus Neomarinimicrobiota bacterium]